MKAQRPVAIVGVGKIALDQHLPTIRASDRFTLAATVSRSGTIEGVPAFASVEAMIAAHPEVRAVAICTPPMGRLELVRQALAAGLDVMIEKPPAATLSEAEAIVNAVQSTGRTLFVSWHSREAAGVEPASEWLRGRRIDEVQVRWKEDVRVWHPGQEWIWEPGIGVFDPGINALSVLSRLFLSQLLLTSAELTFPSNRDAPIAARLEARGPDDSPVFVDFDFDQRGAQTWEIVVKAEGKILHLTAGGSQLQIDGASQPLTDVGEYARLYRRFGELIEAGASDTDLAPFRLVSDAFLIGRRKGGPAFSWEA